MQQPVACHCRAKFSLCYWLPLASFTSLSTSDNESVVELGDLSLH